MADIFTPWRLGSLELPNRLVRSATWEGLAEPDGTPTHDMINLTAGLAEGGVGIRKIRVNLQSVPKLNDGLVILALC